jgi:hypothetical protein
MWAQTSAAWALFRRAPGKRKGSVVLQNCKSPFLINFIDFFGIFLKRREVAPMTNSHQLPPPEAPQ